MSASELNFDGIVGPTHNYAGLAHGNIASASNRGGVSSPRAAALQGLGKAKLLADLGVLQAVLPPQERPDVAALKALGFEGSDAEALHQAAREAPRLLAAVSSASSMWTANAATVSPSADARDARVHFTPANLVAHLHRSLEPPLVGRVLHRIFPDPAHFAHHAPLAATAALGDEGAANHTRLCASFGQPGVELFVYGRDGLDDARGGSARFDTRHTREASEAVIRLHRLDRERVVVARQAPEAVDAGAFHNDVVAVGHRHLLLAHERAWVGGADVADRLARRFGEASGGAELTVRWVRERELSLAEAVGCYLFNSQLVTVADGSIALIAPIECCESGRARAVVERLVQEPGPIAAVHYVDLRQSMRNGGGPACLRLRVELTDAERARMETGTLLTDELHPRLVAWVEKHYRDRLEAADLADCSLLDESRTALDELTTILGLGSIYPFQLAGA